MAKNPKISIVGAGPGSAEYVTPIAKQTVQNADIVIGAERVLNLFADDIKGESIKLTAKNINATLNQAIEFTREGKKVVILSTGDPGFAGLLKTFSKITDGQNVEVNVIPGISSVQVCAARLQLSWDEVRLFSFHEGIKPKKKNELATAVKDGFTVMLLPDSKSFSPAEVAKFLMNEGVSSRTQVFVCENLALNNERIVKGTLGEVSSENFSPLCVMVIKPNP